eukprot:4643891-Pyramimonas_sp.AAC.1
MAGMFRSAFASSTWRSVACGSASRIPSNRHSLPTHASTSPTCRTTRAGPIFATTISSGSVTSRYALAFVPLCTRARNSRIGRLRFVEIEGELIDQCDDKYAIMCVQHDYKPTETSKLRGCEQ